MFFTQPGMLLFAAAALPIIALYMIRRQRRRIPVSTDMFWDSVFTGQGTAARWHELRHLLSLLLQLVIIALLVAALANPLIGQSGAARQRTILILDASASMQSTFGNSTRFEAARAAASEVVAAARPGNSFLLLVAGPSPRVACGFTNERQQLINALQRVTAADSPADLKAACDLATQLASSDAGNTTDRILLLSDGCSDDLAEITAQSSITLQLFGESVPNLALTRFQARRRPSDPATVEILVEISNFADVTTQTLLNVEFDERVIDAVPLSIAPQQQWSDIITFTTLSGGIITAKADVRDGLALDNIAQAVLPERSPIPVTLVTDGNVYLENALLANDLVSLKVTSTIPARAPQDGLLIVDHKPLPKVPPGRVLVVTPVSDCDAWALLSEIEFPVVETQNLTHGLMRNTDFSNTLVARAAHVQPVAPWTPLIVTKDNAPLLFTQRTPDSELVVLTANLKESDLPLRTVFPLLLSNTLNWFFPTKETGVTSVSAGELFQLRPAGQAGPVADSLATGTTLASPTGKRQVFNTEADGLLGPLEQTGIWQVVPTEVDQTQPANEPLRLACNMTNPRESNLKMSLSRGLVAGDANMTLPEQPVWHALSAAAAILLCLEWFLFHRRWIS
jgi:hypothetical protein